MNWFLLKGTLIILIFGISCNPKLEQPNVSISFSFRLDNDYDSLLFYQDFENIQRLGINNIGIELIVRNDTLNFPYLENIQCLNKILSYLENRQFKTHIILSKWNQESIKVADTFLLNWNLNYQKLLQNLLINLKTFKSLSSFAYAVDFENIENMPDIYQNFVITLQSSYYFPIFYSSLLHKTKDCILHNYSNTVGIFYEHHPSDKYKKLARKLHPIISNSFKSKKIFITHSNIQGADAKLQFQNLLRFWESNNLSFINLNSIYNQSVVSRDSNYFSLKKNAEFLTYIQEYCQ